MEKVLHDFLLDSSSSESDTDDSEVNMLNHYFESSSSSNNSSDEDCDRQAHAKVPDFIETIRNYSDGDFKSHFRFSRSTVQYLIDRHATSEYLPGSMFGKTRMGSEKEIYMCIWYICNSVTFRQLGNLFGVAKSSAWTAVRRICHWVISIGHEFVKWPTGNLLAETTAKFKKKKKIPDVIGAIDCSHIVIRASSENKEGYFNRKQQYSIVLQAVVDADKKFVDIYCGEPGSLHDSRVLRRSQLFQKATDNPVALLPENTFILGDSAYPYLNWLVPPYKDNGRLTDKHRQFNYIHSSTRMSVENAFGLLKTRFRRLLHFTEQTNISAVTNLVMSACILHNICILFDDLIDEDVVTTQPDNDSVSNLNEHISGSLNHSRQQILFDQLNAMNVI